MRQDGFSVVELVIAVGILLAVTAAVTGLLHEGLAGTPVLEETTDLHQRARVAVDALAGELRASAAGTASGPLAAYLGAIDPRRPGDPPGSASAAVLTLRYIPAHGAHSRLAQPLVPASSAAIVDAITGCPAGTTACGFVAGTRAVVFDASGAADLLDVDAIGPGILSTSDPLAARTSSYPAGSEIAEVVQVTYYADPPTRQLRRQEGGGIFVLADNVTALAFEYFDADLMPLAPALFQDGPFRGTGSLMFDADVARIRIVRATIRIETGVDAMRGSDPRLFFRPGTAAGRRVIPDIEARLDVSVRNWR
jgi:hypothetical protein